MSDATQLQTFIPKEQFNSTNAGKAQPTTEGPTLRISFHQYNDYTAICLDGIRAELWYVT